MNDPHVAALYYRIKHSDSVDYKKASPLEHEGPEFSLRIDNDEAKIVTKKHHSTTESARAVAESYLNVWEVSAALFDAADRFEFAFKNADVVDRNPTPRSRQVLGAALIESDDDFMSASAHVVRVNYPSPPVGLALNSTVELLYDRYRMYCEDRKGLGAACYFCLTVLQRAAGSRGAAAKKFGIALSVLNKIAELSTNKGGKEARKVVGAYADLTPGEGAWLEKVLKVLVRRAAEVAYDARSNGNQITMSDLPPIP
jgi:hypothetical protein